MVQLAIQYAKGRPVSALEPICGSRPASLSHANERDVVVITGYAAQLDNGKKCSFGLDTGEGTCLSPDGSVRSFKFPQIWDFWYRNIGRGRGDAACEKPTQY